MIDLYRSSMTVCLSGSRLPAPRESSGPGSFQVAAIDMEKARRSGENNATVELRQAGCSSRQDIVYERATRN